jgi:hypothetical protein
MIAVRKLGIVFAAAAIKGRKQVKYRAPLVTVKRSVIAGLAALIAIGGAAMGGAQTASAATATCGFACMALGNSQFGASDLTAVRNGDALAGEAVVLSPAAPVPAEDWLLSFMGSTADLLAQGLVSAQVADIYGATDGYEFQYAPNGVGSGLCLGLHAGARSHEKVRLVSCTADEKDAIWVQGSFDQVGRYAPIIAGSETAATPLVLTGDQVGKTLSIEPLSVTSGAAAADQMWQGFYGVQP